MMKKIMLGLISILVLAGIFAILTLTPIGLRITLHLANFILPGEISYQHVSGVLTAPIEFKNFKYQGKDTIITIKKVKLEFKPFQLLKRKIVITQFNANTIHLTLQTDEDKKTASTSEKTYLLDIKNAEINHLYIGTVPNQYPVYIRHLRTNIHMIPERLRINASVRMLKPFPLTTELNIVGNPRRYTLYLHSFNKQLSWHLYGLGNENSLFLNLSEGKTLGGKLSFKANLNWEKQLQWNIKLLFQAPNAHIHIESIQKEKLGLKWDISIAQLSSLDQDLQGSIQSQGEWQPQGLHFAFQSKNLKIPGLPFQNIQLQGKGTESSHQLSGIASTNGKQFTFQLNGGLFNKTWKGDLQKLQITSQAYHQWQLIKPTAITLSKTQVSANYLCLKSEGANGKLCFNGTWNAKSAWKLNITGQHFNPGALINLALPQIFLNTTANLNATITGNGKLLQSATANLQFNKGQFRYRLNGGSIKTPFQNGQVKIGATNNKISTTAKFVLSKNNTINVSFTLPKDSKHISGKVIANLTDLSPFNKMLKTIAQPKGKLAINLNLSGPLSKPNFSGHIHLKDGSVFIPRLGIELTDIKTNITSSTHGIAYEIQANSKKQPIKIKGLAQWTTTGLNTTATIEGDHVLIMNTPEYIIYASPQFKVLIQGNNIDLTGKVDIPKGIIQPLTFTNVTTLPTEQVVYTAGEPSVGKSHWNISAHVEVSLGKEITVNTHGFNAIITGKATITGMPKKTTLARGRIDIIKGSYSAYGKKLTISPGSYIQFINSPVSNPIFDVRATKLIQLSSSLAIQQFGLNDIIVGIQLRGSLQHPDISFFSIPATLSQADILSYLLLGYSSENAKGSNLGLIATAASAMGGKGAGTGGALSEIKQGLGLSELGVESQTLIDAIGTPIDEQNAFVIGKRLTKKIYIRYSLGLGQGAFAPVNIFQLRYTLNRQWAIQTDSSSWGSGGDILYTIEKN